MIVQGTHFESVVAIAAMLFKFLAIRLKAERKLFWH